MTLKTFRKLGLMEKLHIKKFLSQKGIGEMRRLFKRAIRLKKVKGDKKKNLEVRFNKFIKTRSLLKR